MLQKLHKNAKTNYAMRLAIKASRESVSALAARYHLSWATVKKWRQRESVEDYSSRPERLRTDLTQEQIEKILFERKQFKKTLEDIFFTLEGDIPNLYPMKIYRVLNRYGLNRLPDELVDAERRLENSGNTGSVICILICYTLPRSMDSGAMFTPPLTELPSWPLSWLAGERTRKPGPDS